ncbi:MAG: cysteine desulfurase [Planctomycetes bacterium]|nr:cysteine desulfurase [Planctomycetota bacterium]
MSTNGEQTLDVEAVRKDFPVLQRTVYDRPLVYLDNAATSQKPRCVIDAVSRYYEEINSNVHRGVHRLSMDATSAYEGAREKVQRFLNARSTKEIVWTRGTTESINLVAQSFGRSQIHAGDEIIISHLEHHSNIVPWQLLCEERGASLKVIPMSERGEILLDAYEELLSERTKIVAIGHVSNALGTVNPVEHIIQRAHARGIPVLLDGAQAAPHMKVDVQVLDCDFYTLSGHKMFGPTGIGALYGKEALLERMPPWHGGGDMIKSVSFEGTVFNDLPYKFEAGTPDIAGAVGMGAAVDYLDQVGLDAVSAWEAELLTYGTALLDAMDGVRIFGTAEHKAAVISFEVDGIHPHDLGTVLDREGVAIRAGHHCAQPVMQFYGVPATARASMAFYNTKAELDTLVVAINKAQELFA